MSIRTLGCSVALLAALALSLPSPAIGACNVTAVNPQLAPACGAATVLSSWFEPTVSSWKDTAFWGGANSLTASLDFCRYAGVDKCGIIDICREVADAHFAGAVLLLADGSWDDANWWTLALLDAYSVWGNVSHLQAATKVFDYVYARAWDDVCGGGLWWSHNNHYKNAITNELALDAAMRLYRFTGNSTYLQLGGQIGEWFLQSGMLNPHGMIDDGLTGSCHNNNNGNPFTGWTYNQGVILRGLASLANVTGNATLLDVAVRVANTTITHRVTSTGILEEIAVHNRDGQQFKGIFVRYLGYLLPYLSAPSYAAVRASFQHFLMLNAKSVMAADMTSDGRFGSLWQGPVNGSEPCGDTASPGDPQHCVGSTPQTAVLDLLNTAPAAAGK